MHHRRLIGKNKLPSQVKSRSKIANLLAERSESQPKQIHAIQLTFPKQISCNHLSNQSNTSRHLLRSAIRVPRHKQTDRNIPSPLKSTHQSHPCNQLFNQSKDVFSLEQLGDLQIVLSDFGARAVKPADFLLRSHLLEHREHACQQGAKPPKQKKR